MLWLALFLPDLGLQVFTRGNATPGLLALADSPVRPRLIAVGREARAAGITPGMSVAAARAIAPGLQARMRDARLEAGTLAELAAWAGAFTPRVSLAGDDGLLLEIGGSLRLFGGAEAIRREVDDGLVALGLSAHAALAPTPLAASWFARCAEAVPAGSDDWRAALDRLPLRVLGTCGEVDSATLDLLEGVGLGRIGEVRRLPAAGLARRQAQAVGAVLARARGERPDPRPWFEAPPTYLQRLPLSFATDSVEPLLFACRRLFAGLAGWLTARHAGIDHCRLELLHEHRPPTVLEIVTGTPCRDEARLTLLAREHLAALALPAAVCELRLSAAAPLAFDARAGELFERPGEAAENALHLLARLRARLGSTALARLSAHADHRPAAGVHPLLESPAAKAADRLAPSGPRCRPLWLLPQPKALRPSSVALLSGPERIESGWWDEAEIRRDYYLARGPGDAMWWVFRELDPPGGWYLHGYFG
ncbi:MAG: DNA polymerase Y family protein [Thauera phenolivorans]|uniref:DNA polymerase Y family protein n=1 Tax=Thauera phenolivorans TaxID=1792543 RepID=A0A7X7LTH1_9RHOO|nr:DNA polymerase Y family protein [Thauera phenolivorans]NLF52867.1 DNA polymerase Y family protein [Thauera phenolivorans]